jgi:uncharacterized protein YbgA (DUF1722 family)
MDTRPRPGISACLPGEAVRFDGGHKRDPFVVAFHTSHKRRLLAHGQRHERRRVRATPSRHVNVPEHMLGCFRRALDAESRVELRSLIARFASGVLPLAAPLAMFSHPIRRCGVEYLAGQIYLKPDPDELRLWPIGA